ncbi:ABC transporter ATP-binding protein [Trichocoleus desertorum AS-A10]|uniref:ABC transporter ATP-binding protein n=1 Tax=Trichocoleus desertorum TaxID=1481672 RepID=UPI00329C8B24
MRSQWGKSREQVGQTMAKVRLEGITRQFKEAVAIADITFEVPDGEFWVMVGPSGCGKSTILRTIAGLESATSGNLYIGDRLVNKVPARQRDVAMVFQNYALYPHMSVAENLAFGLKMRKTDSQTIQERVESVARSLDIAHLLDRKPKQLSGGQQQRVALGRAIARKPQVFLLDEPLSNLDAQLRDDTRAELKQLHQRLGITTIYVTHDQVEAMTLADQIVVLKQGRIQQIGDPQTIYGRPTNRMVATFLGNPPMNILSATFEDGAFHLAGQSFTCPSAITAHLPLSLGQSVELGIRPEHLQLVSASEAQHFTVEVSTVEPLGREILIRAVLPTQPTSSAAQVVNLQVSPKIRIRPGDRLSLQIDFAQLFIFDPATGDRLYPAS